MEYKIKIEYCTGNSFGSEDESGYLDLSWKNIDIAKENLKRIKEHYEQYRECSSYSHNSRCRTNKEIHLSNKDKDWFVYVPQLVSKLNGNAIEEKHKKIVGDGNWEYVPDSHFAEHCLKLKADNGNEMQISAFWCGYFEKLYSAEIVVGEDEELKINF